MARKSRLYQCSSVVKFLAAATKCSVHPRSWAVFRRRPLQVFVQEFKRAFAVDAMAPLKEFDLGAINQTQLRIKPACLPVFMIYPRIKSNAIQVPAFHH